AEDGIRDDLVTGVQTCALPISIVWKASTASAARTIGSLVLCGQAPWPPMPRIVMSTESTFAIEYPSTQPTAPAARSALSCRARRSEERRVGKARGYGSRQ